MSRTAITATTTRCFKGDLEYVRADWHANQGIVGTKRQPQPTTYEEEGSR